MQAIRERLSWFLLLCVVWWLVALAAILYTDQKELHLFFNQFYNGFSDGFFKIATWFGDGVFAGLVALGVIIWRWRLGLISTLIFVCTGLITQFLKRIVFPEELRPGKIFEGQLDFHFVEGIELAHHFSFPSGHTSEGFAIFITLAFILKKPVYQVLCFLAAVVVGWSRIYLSFHFFEDVAAGSFVGVVIAVGLYWAFQKWYRDSLPTS